MVSRKAPKRMALSSKGGIHGLGFKHVVCVLPRPWTTSPRTLGGLPGASRGLVDLVWVLTSIGAVGRRVFLDALPFITRRGNGDPEHDYIGANGEGENNERPAQVHHDENE